MADDPEPAAYRNLVEQLLADPSVSEGRMVGMPALNTVARMFGGRRGDRLVLRIGSARAKELRVGGRGHPFDPSGRGRPMRHWVELPHPAEDRQVLAAETLAFVTELGAKRS